MILIVDASVAIKWFVREILHDEALVLLDHRGLLQAPELIVSEVGNAAWKKCLRREIMEQQAQVIVAAVPRYIPVLYPISLDHERALEIAIFLKHPIYDCIYLACAERAGGILVTTDKRLCAATAGSAFESLVRRLDDPDLLVSPLDHLPPLRIPLSKLHDAIRLAEIVASTEHDLLEHQSEEDEGKIVFRSASSYSEPLAILRQSPSYRRLEILVRNLSPKELADLVALMWLGRGYPEDSDWEKSRSNAEGIDCDKEINYVMGLTIYLRDGWERFHRTYVSDPAP